MGPLDIFLTARCRVRLFDKNDFASLSLIMKDPFVMRETGFLGPIEESKIREFLNQKLETSQRPFGVWAVSFLDDLENKLVGFVLLNETQSHQHEIGYVLNKSWWGRGLATELCLGLVEYGFSTLKLKRLIAVTSPTNEVSKKVLIKSGFSFLQRKMHFLKHVSKEVESDYFSHTIENYIHVN